MDKRYQVFVSSTYEDLQVERQEVMQALLELNCIPAGMELFPAANDDQWTLIKKVISECDYYIVISAGRYGSLGANGQSYTELEYRYAVEIGKPTIAFLHKDPLQLIAGRCEQTEDGKKKLKSFRELLQRKMCKHWQTPTELGGVVSRSLVRLMQTAPAVGWIKADEATEALAAPEVLRLRKRIEELERQLDEVRSSAPPGSERLAQGGDKYPIAFSFETFDSKNMLWSWNHSFSMAWDNIFYDIGPTMIDEATNQEIRESLNKSIRYRSSEALQNDKSLKGHKQPRNYQVTDHDFQTIIIQLRALGLITKSQRPRSIKDTETYWTLTPYGDQVLTTLRAITKDDQVDEEAPENTEDQKGESQ